MPKVTMIGKITCQDGKGDEMEAVLAHDLGHFKRRHVLKQLLLSSLLALLGLALLGWLAQQAWFYQGFGVTRAGDATETMSGSA